ncbi:hypothetical protein [Natrinema sp. CGMCC1.2065]|uniref:hypothetical protein n=1 Tax=Natrinema sp. CGMCC1.2065 TaxID=3445767 RepID=UPI003F4A5AD8
MNSREVVVYLGAILLAFVGLLVAGLVASVLEFNSDMVEIAMLLVFYGIALGGGHLYLALRNEGSDVPPSARWRYLAVLIILLVAGAALAVNGEQTIATIELRTIGRAVIGVTIVGYVLTEAVDGYRTVRSS